jgi:hypothetical protein
MPRPDFDRQERTLMPQLSYQGLILLNLFVE